MVDYYGISNLCELGIGQFGYGKLFPVLLFPSKTEFDQVFKFSLENSNILKFSRTFFTSCLRDFQENVPPETVSSSRMDRGQVLSGRKTFSCIIPLTCKNSTPPDSRNPRGGSKDDSSSMPSRQQRTLSCPENSSFENQGASSSVPSTLKSFSLGELKTATKNFRSENLVGEGGFGFVFKGWIDASNLGPSRPGTRTVVAIKKLKTGGFQGHKEWLVSDSTTISSSSTGRSVEVFRCSNLLPAGRTQLPGPTSPRKPSKAHRVLHGVGQQAARV